MALPARRWCSCGHRCHATCPEPRWERVSVCAPCRGTCQNQVLHRQLRGPVGLTPSGRCPLFRASVGRASENWLLSCLLDHRVMSRAALLLPGVSAGGSLRAHCPATSQSQGQGSGPPAASQVMGGCRAAQLFSEGLCRVSGSGCATQVFLGPPN